MVASREATAMNDAGMNSPIMGVSFLTALGLSVTGILTSILVGLVVGLLLKLADFLIRRHNQKRENFWRTEARKWKARARELEQGR
ncbi:MAG TPA: hypothetical protein VGN95_23810 [Pyrinomonadaceae bacterium]|jgi:hypothetical protein|nr:hypothetical protein [Pyrinomonadaceae bacterium]